PRGTTARAKKETISWVRSLIGREDSTPSVQRPAAPRRPAKGRPGGADEAGKRRERGPGNPPGTPLSMTSGRPDRAARRVTSGFVDLDRGHALVLTLVVVLAGQRHLVAGL